MVSRHLLLVVYIILACIEFGHNLLSYFKSFFLNTSNVLFPSEPDPDDDPLHPYYFQPLDSARKQIRLLSILREGRRLRLEVCTFDFATAPAYTALSYTWGSRMPEYRLSIKGTYLVIRENLHRFFLSYPDQGYIWIDQICINQSDVEERSSQVLLMADIYRRAEFVAVWLDSVGYTHHQNYGGRRADEMLREANSLSFIRSNKYFTRLWVVQEVLLAQEVRLLFQGVWIDWDDICDALRSDAPQLLTMRQCRNYPIERCIETFSNQGCEDPRDKVYGLMGLVREEERLKVDYSKSAQEVFCELVMTYCTIYLSNAKAAMLTFGSRRTHDDVSLASQKYVLSLLVLSQRMRFSNGEIVALRPLLKTIWASGGLAELKLRDIASPSPITEMGFSPGHTSKSSRLDPDSNSDIRHCWWLKTAGRTHYYDCCLAEDSCCTSPISSALSP